MSLASQVTLGIERRATVIGGTGPALGEINLALNNNGGAPAVGLRGPLDQTMQGSIEAGGNESGRVCRICLEDDDEEDNPFICPCKCIGSMKFIHLKCLREWTDSKKQFQTEEGVSSYYWENLNCELCKSALNLLV